MMSLVFVILVILSLPLQGAPFMLVHHFTFFYLNREEFNLKARPGLDRSDFWFSFVIGLLIFLLSIVFWNAFGSSAIVTYITILSLFVLSEAWDIVRFWAEKKKLS